MNKFSYHLLWLLSDFWNSIAEKKTTQEARVSTKMTERKGNMASDCHCYARSQNLRFGGPQEVMPSASPLRTATALEEGTATVDPQGCFHGLLIVSHASTLALFPQFRFPQAVGLIF